jgi:hypothetical protein
METSENQLWCKAWRFLRQHGSQSDQLIEKEIEACLRSKDKEGIEYWRSIARAVEELRK